MPLTLFLSYSHADLAQARRLYNVLSERPDIEVWFDKESLVAGQRWERAIRREISERRFFVLLLSRNSTTKRGYYQREIREAIKVLEEYPEREIFLIPVRLEECELHFEELNALQYVDMFPDWSDGVARILRALETHEEGSSSQPPPRRPTMRFATHQAVFMADNSRLFYFLNVANLSEVPTSVTHVWYEDESAHIPILPASRPLPIWLDSGAVWETWVPMDALPERRRGDAYGSFRLRLSSGETYTSVRDDEVPPYGMVPGGPVVESDLRGPGPGRSGT